MVIMGPLNGFLDSVEKARKDLGVNTDVKQGFLGKKKVWIGSHCRQRPSYITVVIWKIEWTASWISFYCSLLRTLLGVLC